MTSVLPSVVVLGLAALAAVALTRGRPSPDARAEERTRASHALALAGGAYFPGLVSAPFVGVAAAWLWVRLRGATAPA